MSTPNSAAWFDGGFFRAPSRTAHRGDPAATTSGPSTTPERKVEFEIAGPANRFAETLAIFGAMSESGMLTGLRVDGHLIVTRDPAS